MKNSLHRILTALTILLLFPVAISVVYEYVRISDSEEMITTVYKNQLESIVSSVNSYAQDVAGTWALRVEQWLKLPNDSTVLQRLVNENSSILAIYTTVDGSTNVLYESQQSESYVYDVDQILETEAGAIDQLLAYNSSNYRKFQSFPLSNGSQVLCFVGNDANEQPVICWVVIVLQKFLQNHLAPRIQAIATGSFVIALRDTVRSAPLIASEMEGERSYTFDQEGDMWLFPSVKIGISLKTQTISDIARKRVKEGLILMAIVLVVLLAGSWFVYSSVRREILLARIKSEFISNVSHEIRTPLALISMYIETLEMGRVKSADKVKEYYGVIGNETRRLTEMVNRILGFSKMEKGKHFYHSAVCDFNAIVKSVLTTYHLRLEEQGFDLQYAPTVGLPAILCDKEAVAQALINLVDNAMKYSRESKVIEISTGRYKQWVYLQVKDHGPGIARKHQKLVFDKFYRVTNRNLAHEVKGTGLGLAIVREIMQAHKGRVTLQSRPGEGCAFRLYFTAVKDSVKA